MEPFQSFLGCRGCPQLSGTWAWVIRAGEKPPGVRVPIRRSLGVVRSGLVGSQMKGTLSGEFFTVSRDWLNLGKAGSPGSARLQTSEHQKRMVDTLVAKLTVQEQKSDQVCRRASSPQCLCSASRRHALILASSAQFAPSCSHAERRLVFSSCL